MWQIKTLNKWPITANIIEASVTCDEGIFYNELVLEFVTRELIENLTGIEVIVFPKEWYENTQLEAV